MEQPLRTLPPLLGHVQADLEDFFVAPLKDYLERLRERSRATTPKIINDPLWHTVRVDPWEIALLDSPVVQRLRNIKQLGLASYVYPGAAYSRFEHTLGVLHQTQRFIEAINRNARADSADHLDPIQQEDQIVLRLAALLHDVGHGFLSHVSERAMMRLRIGDAGDTARQAIRAAKNHWVCKGNPALAEVIAALIVTSSKVVELFDVAEVPRWLENSVGLTEKIARLIVGGNAYHQRQPYAVMIAVVFLPDDACDDASPRHPSSFGSWVKYLRPLAQRHTPQDDIARYERVFIGLYDRGGDRMEFFDVENPPPRTGRPKNILNYTEFLDEIEKTYLRRNASEFEWADDAVDTDEPPPEDET